MKKIISTVLSFVMTMVITAAAFPDCPVSAEETESVTLYLDYGNIEIYPDYYCQNGEIVFFTGDYIISGYGYGDTPLKIHSYWDPVTYDITFDNVQIISGIWETAVVIDGYGSVTLNITNYGNSYIEAGNHAAIEVQSNIDVTVNITNAEGGELTLTRSYKRNTGDGDRTAFYNTKRKNDEMTFVVDGVAINGYGEPHTEHTYVKTANGYTCEICGLKFNSEKTLGIIDEETLVKTTNPSLTYSVEPTYTVTIPAKVTLGDTAEISAENVVLKKNKNLRVTLYSTTKTKDGEYFALKTDEGAEITYTVENNDGTVINVGSRVLYINSGTTEGSSKLRFNSPEITDEQAAGDYKGTVTFYIAVV